MLVFQTVNREVVPCHFFRLFLRLLDILLYVLPVPPPAKNLIFFSFFHKCPPGNRFQVEHHKRSRSKAIPDVELVLGTSKQLYKTVRTNFGIYAFRLGLDLSQNNVVTTSFSNTLGYSYVLRTQSLLAQKTSVQTIDFIMQNCSSNEIIVIPFLRL